MAFRCFIKKESIVMKTITLLFILFCVVLNISCSGGSSGSSSGSPSIEGTDYSGTYNFNNIQCYNTALTTLTNATTISGGFSDTLTVSGNSYSGVAIAGSCTINYSGKIVVNSSGLSLSNRVVTSATSGSCTQTLNLNGTTITPTSVVSTYTTNQSHSSVSNTPYIWNASTKAFGLLSNFSDGTGGHCFLVYIKQ